MGAFEHNLATRDKKRSEKLQEGPRAASMRAACTSTILIRCLFHLSRFSVGRCGPLASASGLSFHLLYRFVSSRTWTLIKPDHPVCPFYRYWGLQLAVRSLNAPVYLPFSTGGKDYIVGRHPFLYYDARVSARLPAGHVSPWLTHQFHIHTAEQAIA